MNLSSKMVLFIFIFTIPFMFVLKAKRRNRKKSFNNRISVVEKKQESDSRGFNHIFWDPNYTTTFSKQEVNKSYNIKDKIKKIALNDNQNIMNEIDLKLSLTEDKIKKYLDVKIEEKEKNTIKYLEKCFSNTETKIEEMLKNKISEIDQKLSILKSKKSNKKYKVDDQIKDEVNKQLASLKANRLSTFYSKLKKKERRRKLLKEMLKSDSWDVNE